MARREGCWNWGGGGEEEEGRQIWTAACVWRQLAALFHDSHMVPSHTEQDPGRDSPAANLSRSL